MPAHLYRVVFRSAFPLMRHQDAALLQRAAGRVSSTRSNWRWFVLYCVRARTILDSARGRLAGVESSVSAAINRLLRFMGGAPIDVVLSA